MVSGIARPVASLGSCTVSLLVGSGSLLHRLRVRVLNHGRFEPYSVPLLEGPVNYTHTLLRFERIKH